MCRCLIRRARGTQWRRVAAEGLPIRRLLFASDILSPSSARHDRVRKRPHYQRHLPDYWIVDLDARLFEHWQSHDDRPALLTGTLTWHPAGARDPFTLDVSKFFDAVFAV